jgi:hypothetical protein
MIREYFIDFKIIILSYNTIIIKTNLDFLHYKMHTEY